MVLKVTVDSVENGQARLLIRPEEKEVLVWPMVCLPAGTQDGDILSIEIHRDNPETAAAQDRVRSLLNRLLDKGQE